jgi:hypothetical protein
MFEDDLDGNPIPCDHPIWWYQRLAALAHRIFEYADPINFHDRMPDWVCEAYERIVFDYPCRQCEMDRNREYGILYKTDADVIDRLFRNRPDFLADHE